MPYFQGITAHSKNEWKAKRRAAYGMAMLAAGTIFSCYPFKSIIYHFVYTRECLSMWILSLFCMQAKRTQPLTKTRSKTRCFTGPVKQAFLFLGILCMASGAPKS